MADCFEPIEFRPEFDELMRAIETEYIEKGESVPVAINKMMWGTIYGVSEHQSVVWRGDNGWNFWLKLNPNFHDPARVYAKILFHFRKGKEIPPQIIVMSDAWKVKELLTALSQPFPVRSFHKTASEYLNALGAPFYVERVGKAEYLKLL